MERTESTEEERERPKPEDAFHPRGRRDAGEVSRLQPNLHGASTAAGSSSCGDEERRERKRKKGRITPSGLKNKDRERNGSGGRERDQNQIQTQRFNKLQPGVHIPRRQEAVLANHSTSSTSRELTRRRDSTGIAARFRSGES